MLNPRHFSDPFRCVFKGDTFEITRKGIVRLVGGARVGYRTWRDYLVVGYLESIPVATLMDSSSPNIVDILLAVPGSASTFIARVDTREPPTAPTYRYYEYYMDGRRYPV